MSITALKTLSLILMTIDHIGAFIPEMPIAFRWIGRLSAPVFLFCLLEGIEKDSNTAIHKPLWHRDSFQSADGICGWLADKYNTCYFRGNALLFER